MSFTFIVLLLTYLTLSFTGIDGRRLKVKKIIPPSVQEQTFGNLDQFGPRNNQDSQQNSQDFNQNQQAQLNTGNGQLNPQGLDINAIGNFLNTQLVQQDNPGRQFNQNGGGNRQFDQNSQFNQNSQFDQNSRFNNFDNDGNNDNSNIAPFYTQDSSNDPNGNSQQGNSNVFNRNNNNGIIPQGSNPSISPQVGLSVLYVDPRSGSSRRGFLTTSLITSISQISDRNETQPQPLFQSSNFPPSNNNNNGQFNNQNFNQQPIDNLNGQQPIQGVQVGQQPFFIVFAANPQTNPIQNSQNPQQNGNQNNIQGNNNNQNPQQFNNGNRQQNSNTNSKFNSNQSVNRRVGQGNSGNGQSGNNQFNNGGFQQDLNGRNSQIQNGVISGGGQGGYPNRETVRFISGQGMGGYGGQMIENLPNLNVAYKVFE